MSTCLAGGLQHLGDYRYIFHVAFSLEAHFHSGCVYLVYHQEDDSWEHRKVIMRELMELFSEKNIFCASFPIRDFTLNSSLRLQCRKNRALQLVLTTGQRTRQALREVSRDVGLSGPRWLIFLESSTRNVLEDFFRGVAVPFDCEVIVAVLEKNESVSLTDVYHVNESLPLLHTRIGEWSSRKGLNFTNSSLYARRDDLQGIPLRAAVTDNPPFTWVHVNKKRNRTRMKGYFSRVWRTVERRINCTTTYFFPEDGLSGTKQADGSWNGMMGMVLSGDVDLIVSELIITPERAVAIDFTLPLAYTRVGLYIQRPESEGLDLDDFLEPFSRTLWFAVLAAIVVLSMYLALLYRVGRLFGSEENGDRSLYGLYDSLLYVFGIFCMQGHIITPRSCSCRVVYLTAYLAALVIVASYSACLIAVLATQKAVEPFSTFEDFHQARSHSLAINRNSPVLSTFQVSTDPLIASIYRHQIAPIRHALPVTDVEGLDRLCGSGHYAFMTLNEKVLASWRQLHCSVMEIPRAHIPVCLAMGLPQRSPYRELINHKLQDLRRSGVLVRFRRQEWPQSLPDSRMLLKSVSLLEAAPMLFLLGAGAAIAVTLLGCEKAARQVALWIRRRRSRACRKKYLERTLYKKKHRSFTAAHFREWHVG